MRLFAILAVTFLIFGGITYLLHILFSVKKYIKYIPAAVLLAMGIYNIYLAQTSNGEGFQDIARILIAVVLFIGSLAGIITALILDFVLPKFKKREF